MPPLSTTHAGAAPAAAVTCHQDDSNRGMVNAEFLAHCKQGVRIVNVARGEQWGAANATCMTGSGQLAVQEGCVHHDCGMSWGCPNRSSRG